MTESAETQALAALRAHQEAMGMTFDDTPVPPELGSVDEEFR